MASESPQMDTTASQTGASQTAVGQDETGAKRKAEQSNGTSTRTKRNRYISIAWYDPRTSDVPDTSGYKSGMMLMVWPVMSANGGRSSAMGKCRVSAAGT